MGGVLHVDFVWPNGAKYQGIAGRVQSIAQTGGTELRVFAQNHLQFIFA